MSPARVAHAVPDSACLGTSVRLETTAGSPFCHARRPPVVIGPPGISRSGFCSGGQWPNKALLRWHIAVPESTGDGDSPIHPRGPKYKGAERMSDISQGPDWWQALDGKWYPPRQQSPGTAQSEASLGPAAPFAEQGAGTNNALWPPPARFRSPPVPPRATPPSEWSRPSGSDPTMFVSTSPTGRSRFGHAKLLIAIGGAVLILATVSPLVLGAGSGPKTGAGKAVLPSSITGNPGVAGGVPGTPTTTRDTLVNDWLLSHASPQQTVTMATAIATSLWTSRNQALAQGDADTIAAIETGPTRLIDDYDLVMAQCGSRSRLQSARSLPCR